MFGYFKRKRQRESGMLKLVIGIIILLGALPMITFNEFRDNNTHFAKNSIFVDGNQPAAEANGKFVAASAVLSGAEMIGDLPYLKPGDYLLLSRKVEMYAWIEKSKSNKGSEEKFYRYEQEWTEKPANSTAFNSPEGHENPPMPLASQKRYAKNGRLGKLAVELERLKLPTAKPLTLSADMIAGQYPYDAAGLIYSGKGTPSQPEIGDLRISYKFVPANRQATVLAKLEGHSLVPFAAEDKPAFYRAFWGSRDEAIVKLGKEYTSSLWGGRIFGILFLWLAVYLLFSSPFNFFAGSLLGGIAQPGSLVAGMGKFALAIVAFVLAFVAWLLIFLIAAVIKNWIIALVIIAVIGLVIAGFLKYH